MITISNETPLSFLTVGQFLELLNTGKQPEVIKEVSDSPKRYVYGLHGIKDLFQVSHVTAFRYKEGFLKDAVSQRGRKIVVDVDKAMGLFNAKNGGQN